MHLIHSFNQHLLYARHCSGCWGYRTGQTDPNSSLVMRKMNDKEGAEVKTVCRMVVSIEEEKLGAWRGGEEGFTERVTSV